MAPSLFRRFPVKRGHERSTRWFFRLFEQPHPRLIGQTVAFLAVTADTGYDDIFPRSAAPTVTRNYMIHVQFLGRKVFSTVLALVSISFQQILPVELHFLHQHTVVRTENQNARHQHFLINRVNDANSRTIFQFLAIRKPSIAIEHPKASILCKNHLGVVQCQQAKSPFYPNDIDRLPKTVENKGLITGIHPPQDITDFPPSMSKGFSRLLHTNRSRKKTLKEFCKNLQGIFDSYYNNLINYRIFSQNE